MAADALSRLTMSPSTTTSHSEIEVEFYNSKGGIQVRLPHTLRSYAIQRKLFNLQANSVFERVHQVLSNVFRTFHLRNFSRTDKASDPFDEVLASTAFAIRSPFHTELDSSPGQLVFRRDMIFPTIYVANWRTIQQQRELRVKRDTNRENQSRIDHDYRKGDLVLILRDDRGSTSIRKIDEPTQGPRKIDEPTQGPFRIRRVHKEVTIDQHSFHECINIRRLVPYFSPNCR